MQRRSFLKRTSTAVAGVTALGASRTAAYHTPEYVSTREHFDDDANLTSGHTTTDYDTSGGVPGVDTSCVGDLTVFVHGWDKKSSDSDAEAAAYDKIQEAAHELDADGYDGTTIGYTWDSDKGGGADYGWYEAEEIAQKNGPKLAQFAKDFKYLCGGSLRFVSHSLGAQVVLSALRELDVDSTWDYYGWEVESVHLQGAAQDNEAPTLEWEDTYYAIANETRATFNYYSEEDDTLEWIYNSFEFDQALGETGKESGNTAPDNYWDYDATSQVGDDHSSYMQNCSDEIVYHMEHVGYYD